jgi:hypothetical protein
LENKLSSEENYKKEVEFEGGSVIEFDSAGVDKDAKELERLRAEFDKLDEESA